jgi:hypothetical protein
LEKGRTGRRAGGAPPGAVQYQATAPPFFLQASDLLALVEKVPSLHLAVAPAGGLSSADAVPINEASTLPGFAVFAVLAVVAGLTAVVGLAAVTGFAAGLAVVTGFAAGLELRVAGFGAGLAGATVLGAGFEAAML